MESVANLGREHLLVYSFLIELVGFGVAHEDTAEERSAAYVADIEEHIVVAVNVVVYTTLDCSAYEILCLGAGTVVVEEVAAPVSVVVERTGKHKIEFLVEHGVFTLGIDTLLGCVAM